MRSFVIWTVLGLTAGCFRVSPAEDDTKCTAKTCAPVERTTAPKPPVFRFMTSAGAGGIAGHGADGVSCAATCQSELGERHRFRDGSDATGLVGRWLLCAPSGPPRDDLAGVEFTRDGRLIVLRRNGNGEISPGVESDDETTFWMHGATPGTGSFEVIANNPAFNPLDGTLYDCPKGLQMRNLFKDAEYYVNDFIFDTGIEPSGCRIGPPVGCDACGNLKCPAGAGLTSACHCEDRRSGQSVRPLSQPCNNCCGKECAPGEFLDWECECF